MGFSRPFCWWWLQGSAGRASEGAKCSEQQLKGDVSFLLKSGSTLMHKDQLQFQNSCRGLCESLQAPAVKSAPSMDRVREGHEEHLFIWPFSYLDKDKIPSFHSKLITGQTKLGNHSNICFALTKPWQTIELKSCPHPKCVSKPPTLSAVKSATRGLNQAGSVQR